MDDGLLKKKEGFRLVSSEKTDSSIGLDSDDMLEERPCLMSRDYPRICMNYRLEKVDVQQSKRPLDSNGDEEFLIRKVSKRSGDQIDTSLSIGGILMSLSEKSHQSDAGDNNSDSSSLISAIGIGGADSKLLTCAEEYDLETRTWTEIPNMSPGRAGAERENEPPTTLEAPPLIAVVNNELYTADYSVMEVRKYDKINKRWLTVGRLPERADSMNGWGLAFRACGDRLIVIGGPRNVGGGFIEVNSWVPSEGPPQWEMLGRKGSGSFVYNCAVMGC
ncbi:hypothetical protein BUALT_Bualt05G0149700 [Buddleja alternifolia]|uniref:F-box/kelch-repeat protein SKIP11 n=1 Tax=Buddleja alternifolia TaxID=168488 RepID=A0AAV6XR94_9LAMI|nr:hypothetical protein BUALT_Bualt05G0149700 [Buddleja alternifolia]